MRKRVLLLAVSCKNGGLCPGGLDLDNPRNWIRIVKNDGRAGAVQGHEIDFAKPLDIIEFDGRHMPQGKQQENWVIDNNSCRKIGSKSQDVLDWAFQQYGYNDFWGNYKSFLDEDEFNAIRVPSESIMKVSDVDIYKNNYNKWKIDFNWHKARFKIKGISLTDPDFYGNDQSYHYDNAYIVTSIPKECDWTHPDTGEHQAYKFVSKVYKT